MKLAEMLHNRLCLLSHPARGAWIETQGYTCN